MEANLHAFVMIALVLGTVGVLIGAMVRPNTCNQDFGVVTLVAVAAAFCFGLFFMVLFRGRGFLPFWQLVLPPTCGAVVLYLIRDTHWRIVMAIVVAVAWFALPAWAFRLAKSAATVAVVPGWGPAEQERLLELEALGAETGFLFVEASTSRAIAERTFAPCWAHDLPAHGNLTPSSADSVHGMTRYVRAMNADPGNFRFVHLWHTILTGLYARQRVNLWFPGGPLDIGGARLKWRAVPPTP